MGPKAAPNKRWGAPPARQQPDCCSADLVRSIRGAERACERGRRQCRQRPLGRRRTGRDSARALVAARVAGATKGLEGEWRAKGA